MLRISKCLSYLHNIEIKKCNQHDYTVEILAECKLTPKEVAAELPPRLGTRSLTFLRPTFLQ